MSKPAQWVRNLICSIFGHVWGHQEAWLSLTRGKAKHRCWVCGATEWHKYPKDSLWFERVDPPKDPFWDREEA